MYYIAYKKLLVINIKSNCIGDLGNLSTHYAPVTDLGGEGKTPLLGKISI